MIDNLPISVDKVIKHSSLFTLSKPNPSEADVMIKIWADLFEALLKIINMQIMGKNLTLFFYVITRLNN